jgi:hypothetical protein
MSRVDKIVTSQIDGNTNAKNEPNTYSYDSDGILVRSNSNRVGKPVVGPGVLYGANGDSSEMTGLNTIKLIPNEELMNLDQYLIIEPTTPDHIHIRAGGTVDESGGTLILGGERNSVIVSDEERAVGITARYPRIENNYANSNQASNGEFMVASGADIQVGYTVSIFTGGPSFPVTAVTNDYPYEGLMTVVANGLSFITGEAYTFVYESPYNHLWQFDEDGYFRGPAMGDLYVTGLTNTEGDLSLGSQNSVVLSGNTGGEFLGSSATPGNQIAKLSDRAYVRVNVPTSSIGQAGDVAHYVADDTSHHYFCTGTYDGTTHIWKRIAWSADQWGV